MICLQQREFVVHLVHVVAHGTVAVLSTYPLQHVVDVEIVVPPSKVVKYQNYRVFGMLTTTVTKSLAELAGVSSGQLWARWL